METKIDRQFSLITEILSKLFDGCIDVVQEDGEYGVFTSIGSVVYDHGEQNWYVSFDFSSVNEIRHALFFSIVLVSLWEYNTPVFISEPYHSVYDNEGNHIYDLRESEIYETMQDSGEDNYEIVKEHLKEFYRSGGIRDHIH